MKSSLFVGKAPGKKHCLVFIFLLVSLLVEAQGNLVPNGSFENYSTCPSGFGALEQVDNWFQPNLAGNSSDAFNLCYFSTDPYMSVPLNGTYQYSKTGNGYAGIYLYWDTTSTDNNKWREYLEVGLTDSLITGKKYCVRFYVNKGNWSMWAIKNIQAVLTNDSLLYNDNNYTYISGVTPIMEASAIVYDTVNWLPIETTYTANGGEKFLIIGNFSSGASTIYQQVLPYSSVPNTLGYYLFDDVSVYEQPDVFAGNDTVIPPGDSIQLGTTGRPDIFYSWNPASGLSDPSIANPMATPGTTTTYTLTVTDTNSLACTSVLMDTVTIGVGFIGIPESSLAYAGKLYPNPAGNSCIYEAQLNQTQAGYIHLFDLAGKVLQTHALIGGDNKIEMDITSLANGVYMYQIVINDETIAHEKLIICR
jgi:hypothetical protein